MKFFEWLKAFLTYLFRPQPQIPPAKPTPALPQFPKEPQPPEGPKPPRPSIIEQLAKLQEGTPEWYRLAFSLCTIDKGFENAVLYNVKTVLNGKARYLEVEKRSKIPWWIVGCIHFKEASCNFEGILHNGQHGIIGPLAMQTGKKSTIVPKGVGPFPDWETAAVDALAGARWVRIKAGVRDIGELLYAVERYNGTGYITGAGKAETSPYLWARSNINDDKGKYVRDGVFNPEASTQKTTGFAVLLKELIRLGEVKL